jgi:hypothetical protein
MPKSETKKPAVRTAGRRTDAGQSVPAARTLVNYSIITPRDRAQTFERLVRDREIPHGAVRLFFLLFTYANDGNTCYPGQRALRKALGCCSHSLKPWIAALLSRGYLSTESGSEIALVLAKARRAGRYAAEPRRVGVDRWMIQLGEPVDDFDRRPINGEKISTFKSIKAPW